MNVVMIANSYTGYVAPRRISLYRECVVLQRVLSQTICCLRVGLGSERVLPYKTAVFRACFISAVYSQGLVGVTIEKVEQVIV